jgi:hypothetical protein
MAVAVSNGLAKREAQLQVALLRIPLTLACALGQQQQREPVPSLPQFGKNLRAPIKALHTVNEVFIYLGVILRM